MVAVRLPTKAALSSRSTGFKLGNNDFIVRGSGFKFAAEELSSTTAVLSLVDGQYRRQLGEKGASVQDEREISPRLIYGATP